MTRSTRITSQDSAEGQRTQVQYQAAVRNFDAAVRAFQKQNYDKAKEIFEKLATCPASEVANRALVYLRMCEQKLTSARPVPKTAAEFYELGVAQLNARSLDEAIESLNKAHKLEPNQDHVRYALAAAHSLQGNVEAALEDLKAAIERRPENRFLAGKDEDFLPLASDPRFMRLLQSGTS